MRPVRSLLPFALALAACGESPCEPCGIRLEEALALEDAGYTMSTHVARTRDGGFVAVGTWDRERVVRFDSGGRIVGTAGRKGGGPGEFERLTRVAVGHGDTLLLADGPRIHFVDAHLNWIRTVTAPVATGDLIVLPDGAIVAHPVGMSRGEPSLFRLHPDSALRVTWFDDHSGEVREAAYRTISHHGGEIWSVGRMTLDVRVFDLSAALIDEFRIDHQWFDGEDPDAAARVNDVVHASDGNLLVLVSREREDWEPARPAGAEESAPVALSSAEVVDRWEQRILRIDRSGAVKSSSPSLDGIALMGFADAGHAFGHRGEEELTMRVWRVLVDAQRAVSDP